MPSPLRSAGFRWCVVAPLMLAAFVASFLFVTFHLMRAVAAPQRDKLVAELDASDPNWRTVALTDARNAALPPPDQNAAELAHQAEVKLPKAYREWERSDPSSQWRGDLKNPHLPHKDQIADTRAHLRMAKDSLRMARDIRHVPGGGFAFAFKEPTMINSSLEKQQRLRQVMSLLSFDAAVRAYDRDDTGALESCLAILAVSRGIGDEPTLVSQLIRMAGVAICVGAVERALGWGADFNDATLADLDRAFAREADEPRLLYGLRGERACFFRITENIDSGTFDLNEAIGPRVPSPMAVYVRARLPEEQAEALKMFNKMIAAASQPAGAARTNAVSAASGECEELCKTGRVGPLPTHLLFAMLVPALFKLNEADTRTVANLNAARVAIACERHRQKTGAYPDRLEDLPKELLPAVPDDPFTGKPILYKKLPDGAVAYSASYDGVDDGAAKLDPKREKGNDLGFRLWALDARRKPPEPSSKLYTPPGLGFGLDLSDLPKANAPTAPPPLSPWVKQEK